MGKLATILGSFTAVLGCSTLVSPPSSAADATPAPPVASVAPAPRRPATVVLLAIDGARWQEIFQGTDRRLLDENGLDASVHARTAEQLMPHLAALARSGVALGAPGHGAPFSASGPNFVSLPGYTELLSGHPATCQENDCEPPGGTLFDAVFVDPSGHAEPTALVASWERLAAFGAHVPASVAVTAGRVAPARGDWLASLDGTAPRVDFGEPEPEAVGSGDYRSDRQTRAVALAYLERERPGFLFVSLGDTDEHAHAGNYAGYLRALEGADDFVGDVVAFGERVTGERDVVVFVTADHGRAEDFRDHGRDHPESARTFLIAGGGPLRARGYVASPEPRHLADVAPTIAAIQGLDWAPASGSTGGAIPEVLEAAGSLRAGR